MEFIVIYVINWLSIKIFYLYCTPKWCEKEHCYVLSCIVRVIFLLTVRYVTDFQLELKIRINIKEGF